MGCENEISDRLRDVNGEKSIYPPISKNEVRKVKRLLGDINNLMSSYESHIREEWRGEDGLRMVWKNYQKASLPVIVELFDILNSWLGDTDWGADNSKPSDKPKKMDATAKDAGCKGTWIARAERPVEGIETEYNYSKW